MSAALQLTSIRIRVRRSGFGPRVVLSVASPDLSATPSFSASEFCGSSQGCLYSYALFAALLESASPCRMSAHLVELVPPFSPVSGHREHRIFRLCTSTSRTGMALGEVPRARRPPRPEAIGCRL